MKKMILLLLLLWLFTGCASTEQTVSEAESSDSEQLLLLYGLGYKAGCCFYI